MPGTIVWGSGGTTYNLQASGQGISLANGGIIQLSGQLNNNGASGGPNFFASVELVGAPSTSFGAAINANVTVDLYLLPSRDGTNFVQGSTSGLPLNHLKGSFVSEVSGNSASWRMAVDNIPLMPVTYKAWIQNNTGQTLNSGYTVTATTFPEFYN